MPDLATTPDRRVRGVLFVDYVRMIRSNKQVDWSRYLSADDQRWLDARIDPDGWYPMESFQHFGIAILHEIAKEQLDGVQMWGRFQVLSVRKHFRDLVVDGDPTETLVRFRVLAQSFFDYAAIEVVSMEESDALIAIQFKMGQEAEATACHQTVGFFLGLMESAGARNVHCRFLEKGWEGASHTLVDLRWEA